ncbi:MAG: DNA mismatch repair endonuclease MutL [Bacteroidales bacterium]
MSDVIHVLSDAVANQIAAGEVIQRPASVVKELMENAVDAEARTIKVVITEAGKAMIQVIDDGCGMNENDARRCFERHATSKISRAEDLFAIRTRGFRGEALASMAAVAEVSLKTKMRGEELGTHVRVSGSRMEVHEPVQTPPGTNFQVKNLFFNVPARRKFLKSDHTELRHIINEFNHVALTHPHVECSLIHNQTEILHLPPANLRKRIIGIFGKATNNYLIPLETETSLIKITGFIGKPEHARKTYGEQYFFVNNRFIKHPYFHKAVMSGYEQILAPDHFPSYFIYFETDPSRVDINIHPSKTEVKFEDEKAIWQILLAAVKEAIGRHNLSPSLDFEREGVIDIPVLRKDSEIHVPGVTTNPEYNPFEEERTYSRNNTTQHYPDNRYQGWEKFFEPTLVSDAPAARHLQVKNKYIFSPVKSGVMMIDQRRAHERILYEMMRTAQHKNKPLAQITLFPETIRLGTEDYQVCLQMLDELAGLGFDIRDLGNNNVVIHGLPSDVALSKAEGTLESMLEQFKSMEGLMDIEPRDRIARAAAKASAIEYGRPLSDEEMKELVDQLFACSNHNYTPSGKPILKIIDLAEIETYFKV